jgi:transposase-like protein
VTNLKLTKEEQDNWNSHFKKHSFPKHFPGRKEKIIELTAAGMPIKEIRKEVTGNMSTVTEVRMRARRRGLV